MREVQFIKGPGGTLRPATQMDVEALEKIGNGSLLHAKIVQPRNGRFHRKFMAMIGLGYEMWRPEEIEYNGIKSVKSSEVFRKEVTIRAGFFTVTTDIRGNTKLEAQSLSFASMDDTEFSRVYSAVFNVIWEMVLKHVRGMTKEQADNTINQMLDFD